MHRRQVVPRPYDAVFLSSFLGTSLDESGQMTGGGAEAQVLMLARGLAQRGLRVCIATWEPKRGLPASVGGVDLVAFPRLASWSRFAAVSYPVYAARFVRALARIQARTYIQRGVSPDTALVALTARLRRARFVYSTGSLFDFDYGRLEPRRTLVWLFKLGYRLADVVVVQTAEQARLSSERLGRNATLIGSIAEPQPTGSREPEAFLWIGRIDEIKRPRAYVELARAVPEARFWMIIARVDDAPPALAGIEQASAELPNIELLPQRPRSAILELISRSAALVSTSESEGMPNVFLEAWAQGVPTLSLSHDPDGVIKRFGLGGVAGDNPQELARMAAELWSSRDDQEEVAAACRQYVAREHDLDRVVEKWAAILAPS
jgi:glycosyltransferase involved in cell wall biosynthesis